ncbi:182 kDa tankyrase-1-binding protein isoform X2 [Erinaceus europaeus]|uniref:182 kDa tankyrase-1-binding protein isoform X2 n=1 Tax=Erinaceus europaeus TaxID=9365 RepID=A0A1S2ZHX9_ERIEU|nr:182 kDa tankyrase-1-binding protein isoform X2 [Erinaceus europaeus]XP_060032188.1 182 kDa tankyrase-1-binding protein isoform X2 [Erinaceus europaeus]XP_060032189.1 182 kDa tankyrase-1-binding protein isoform X2 [Erinaceus europaeus]
MKVVTLRDSVAMASPAPQETEEELVSAGPEPGDPRTKPPVKPKPRALPTKPALPAKPSLLVPVGPRPPRGPLAELPSARKMNLLAGPQPYGGSKRPLPFAPRPAAEASSGGETGKKEEPVKEETPPPLTPPARCAAPGGVRKAPAPFRPTPERCGASTVEEILAKMEQPRKEVPPSPDRLWGSRLTFNHDGSSRYGPRTYGVAPGPREEEEEDAGMLSRAWSQDVPAKSPTVGPEEPRRSPEERSPRSDQAFNGDLAQLGSSEPPANDVSKPQVPSSPDPACENGGTSSPGPPTALSDPVQGSPQLRSPAASSPQHPQPLEAHVPEASLHLPQPPASPASALPEGGSHHLPSPVLPAAGTLESPRSSSPPLVKVLGCRSPEQPPDTLARPLMEGGEMPDLSRTFPPGLEEEAATAPGTPRPTSLAQRRFSEGVLRPSVQDHEKLGGSLVALAQTQGSSQSALDRPFGSGTESNWSLSQSFEWTFPTRPSGLGGCRLDSPPPSPITEATEAAEAAEAGDWASSVREDQRPWPAPEGSGRLGPGVQADELGTPKTPKESQPLAPARAPEPLAAAESPPGSALLQAEERCGEREPLAGQESPLTPTPQEAALPILEPIPGQQQPAPSNQPCILFFDAPGPSQALPVEEEPVTLAQVETTQPRTGMETQDPRHVSPEPEGSRWLDDLLASPPPATGGARRGVEPKDAPLAPAQTPNTCPEGLLGWSQKDLQSEFGIAADPHPSDSFSTPSWSQEASQDYALVGVSPRGDLGLREPNWSSRCGPGAGEESTREWASRHGLGPEELRGGSPDGSPVPTPGGLAAQARVIGKPSQQNPEAEVLPDWEFQKREPQGTYSSRDAELQDQEFGKRDSLGSYSSQEARLQDWEFGKRDSLGAYSSRDAEGQSLDSGRNSHLGRYEEEEKEEEEQEFGTRESLLSTYSQAAEQLPEQDFGKSAWMGSYSDSTPQDRGFGPRAQSAGFSPKDAQQQDEEFEKKTPSGDGLGEVGRGTSQLEERGSGDLFSPSTPVSQAGVLGQKDQSGWQSSSTGPETQSPADGEAGQLGWASEFCLGLDPQLEMTFRAGQQNWSGGFCTETADRSHQFGIIGNDRAGDASPSPPDTGGRFTSEKPSAEPMDWADQLGLRNLEVPSCVVSGGLSEAREETVGRMGWSDELDARDVDTAGRSETGGSEDPRGLDVGEEDWTLGLSGPGEVGSLSQTRESGVGQTDWSGVEAGEFLKSRERGVGQADWTPDLGLRNIAPRPGCSPSELRPGQVDWTDNLGLRNLEVPCAMEPEGSRGCGVGQMDWTHEVGLLRGPREARELGVGEVSQPPEPGLRDNDISSPGLEATELSEIRELGVREMSGPETPGKAHSPPALEEHLGMDTGDAPSFGASPSGCPARSPPSGAQAPLGEMLAASSTKAAAHRESSASSLRGLSEEEDTTVGADRGESHGDPLPSWRPQPDGEASRTEEVDGSWGPSAQGPLQPPRRPSQGPPSSSLSQDFSFIEDTEVLDSAMYRSRASLGRKRGHRAPAIRPGGTLGLSESADSEARLFQDSTEPRASRMPSSDEEVVEEPQNRRTRMSLGAKGLKVNLFPGLSPSALKARLRPRNRSAEEGEPTENKSNQKESAVQRSKSCKVPGLGKPLTLPPKPEKSSGSEGSSPNWLQALKLKKKKV